MIWMLVLRALGGAPVEGEPVAWESLQRPLLQVEGETSHVEGRAGARLGAEGLSIAVAVRDARLPSGQGGDAVEVAFRFDAPEGEAVAEAGMLARTELRVVLDRDAIRMQGSREVVPGGTVAWQDTPGGYTVEARIPLTALPLTRSSWIGDADLQIRTTHRDGPDRQAVYALSDDPWSAMEDVEPFAADDGLRRALSGWWAPTGAPELWRWEEGRWRTEAITGVRTVFARDGVEIRQVPAHLTGDGPALVVRNDAHVVGVVRLACEPALRPSILGLEVREDCDGDGTAERRQVVGPDGQGTPWTTDGSCEGRACERRHLHLTTALRASLLVGGMEPWSSDLPDAIACVGGADACFRERLPDAHLLITFTDVVVIDRRGGAVRYARTRPFDGDGAPLAFDQDDTFRRAESGRTADRIALQALAGTPPATSTMQLDVYEPTGDLAFEQVRGDTVRVAHPFEHDPTVFCADGRVLRGTIGHPHRIVTTGGSGILGTQVVVRTAYRLPCAASLVLGARIDATFGDRWVPASDARSTNGKGSDGDGLEDRGRRPFRAEPPRDADAGASVAPCLLPTGDERVLPASCADGWIGDLNGDGRPDLILESRGELGCGDRRLMISVPGGGYATASRASWEC